MGFDGRRKLLRLLASLTGTGLIVVICIASHHVRRTPTRGVPDDSLQYC